MSTWWMAFGYLSYVVKLLNDILAAEAAGKGTVELPAFQIHTHKKTWHSRGGVIIWSFAGE